MADRPLIVVFGPTGSGKSHVAIQIAERFGGEIVNSDSVQMYRGFDIGSAKVPEAERRGIAHHLIDVLEPAAICTAGEYARLARETIAEISNRGKIPILAGGTGFYVRALLYGLFEGPQRDDELRERLMAREGRRKTYLHRLLRRLDPAAAQRIHFNDINKLVRAVEVCLVSRRSITEMFAEGSEPLKGYIPLKFLIDPPRGGLYCRLDERSRLLFDGGLVEEVRGLLSQGVPETAKPFESIGYQQALQLIRGEMTREEGLESMQRATRRYAKRQMTWWRKEPDTLSVSGFGTDEVVERSILDTVQDYLGRFTQ